MLHGLRDIFFDVGIAKDELVVGLEDIEASNALEFGHVMPEVGEEAAWLEKTGIKIPGQ